jgi:hypothetical protein
MRTFELLLSVRGTDHVTFSDLYRIINVPSVERISIRRAHRIINDCTIAFFESVP